MCIQFVGRMGNPKKCLSVWVSGKIIPNLSCKEMKGKQNQNDYFFSTFKSFKTFGEEFLFKKT